MILMLRLLLQKSLERQQQSLQSDTVFLLTGLTMQLKGSYAEKTLMLVVSSALLGSALTLPRRGTCLQ